MPNGPLAEWERMSQMRERHVQWEVGRDHDWSFETLRAVVGQDVHRVATGDHRLEIERRRRWVIKPDEEAGQGRRLMLGGAVGLVRDGEVERCIEVTLALCGPDCVRSPNRRDRSDTDVVEHPGDNFDRGLRDRLRAQPRDARDDWVFRFTPAPIILIGRKPPQPVGEPSAPASRRRRAPEIRPRRACPRDRSIDASDRNGGYFITRLATNADPCIVATHHQWRGRSIELEGKRLREVAGRLKRDVLDVDVEVAFKRRVYGGIRRTARRRLRLVAVRLPDSSDYRFYLTNIDPDSLDAHAVAQTYAARWQIELIFKALKSHYRLEELPTRKAHIVEPLLLGAVITLLVSRRLLLAVQERLRRTPYKMPEQRWAAIFAAAAPAILDIVVLPPRVSKVIARRLDSMLLHEAPDPNRSRQLLIERVERGAAWS